jgi:thymidylate kinase
MLIAFAGIDGAGKSTQVNRVHRWLEEEGWPSEIVDRWDILDEKKFPECRFIRSSREEVRVCNSEMEGIGRAMFLFWTISLVLDKVVNRDPSRVYLLDGYWMKHAVAEIEYGCDPDWIDATVRALPAADVTIYLDITPEEALSRKPELTPYECARNPDLNPEDFLRHQGKMRTRLQRWAVDLNWEVISSMQDESQVTQEIGSYLKSRLPLRDRAEVLGG